MNEATRTQRVRDPVHGLIVFRNEDGVWRLVDFDGDMSMLRPPKGK